MSHVQMVASSACRGKDKEKKPFTAIASQFQGDSCYAAAFFSCKNAPVAGSRAGE
jgi:hypothetical protein